MSSNCLLPGEKAPRAAEVFTCMLKDTQFFQLGKMGIVYFQELLSNPDLKGVTDVELFFSNTLETQWGHARIVNGKITITPLIELNVISVTPVQQNGLCADGYIVKYCLSTMFNVTELYIEDSVLVLTLTDTGTHSDLF